MTDRVNEGARMRVPSSQIPTQGGWEEALTAYAIYPSPTPYSALIQRYAAHGRLVELADLHHMISGRILKS